MDPMERIGGMTTLPLAKVAKALSIQLIVSTSNLTKFLRSDSVRILILGILFPFL